MQRQGRSRKAAVTHCMEDDAQYGVSYCLPVEPAFQHPASKYNPGQAVYAMQMQWSSLPTNRAVLYCVPCSALLLLLLPSRASEDRTAGCDATMRVRSM